MKKPKVKAARELAGAGTPRLCRLCKNELLDGAVKCTHCDGFQDWRAFLPETQSLLGLVAALLAIVAGIVPAILWLTGYGSDTEIQIVGVTQEGTEKVVLVAATNSGGRPSVVRSITLSEDKDRGIPQTTLKVRNPKEQVLQSKEAKTLFASVDGFQALPGWSRDAVLTALQKPGKLMLIAEVEETGMFYRSVAKPEAKIEARVIHEWVADRLPPESQR